MPFPELDEFRRTLDGMAAALGGEDLKTILTTVGVEAKKDAAEAVQREGSRKGSLADQSMSHWRRGNPFELTARFDIDGGTATVAPERRLRGPWRVLEDGRAHGSATDLVLVGRARKDGTRRARSRGRNQGRTAAKNTWSDATELMEKRTPKRAQDELVRVATARWGR